MLVFHYNDTSVSLEPVGSKGLRAHRKILGVKIFSKEKMKRKGSVQNHEYSQFNILPDLSVSSNVISFGLRRIIRFYTNL